MATRLLGQGLADLLERPDRVLQRERAALVAGRGHDHERDVRAQDRLPMAQGRAETRPVASDGLVQIRLLHGRAASVDRVHRVSAHVHADDLEAPVGDARRHGRPQLAQPDDRIPHVVTLRRSVDNPWLRMLVSQTGVPGSPARTPRQNSPGPVSKYQRCERDTMKRVLPLALSLPKLSRYENG